MTSIRRTGRFAILASIAVVMLLLSLVGCSSKDETTSSTTTVKEGAKTGDGSASDKFRIGVEAPLSGSQADLGKGMLDGAKFAAAELNKDGGFDGREIEIVPIDDKADPAAGEEAAKEAIAAGLDAIVGPYNSGVGTKTLPLYVEAGLVPMRLTSADDTAGIGFTLQPMTSQIAPVTVKAIQDWAKAESVGIIYDSTEGYTLDAAKATEALLKSEGVTVTSSVEIEPGADSYADAVSSALEKSPDLIFVVAYYPEAGVVAKDLQANGADTKCLVDYGGFDNGYLTAAGDDAASRCEVVGVPAPTDFPEGESFTERFKAEMGADPGVWSPFTYDSVMVLVDAAKRAGGTEVEALSKELAATADWSGWTGTVNFEADTGNREPAPVTANKVNDDGKFTVDESWATAVGFKF